MATPLEEWTSQISVSAELQWLRDGCFNAPPGAVDLAGNQSTHLARVQLMAALGSSAMALDRLLKAARQPYLVSRRRPSLIRQLVQALDGGAPHRPGQAGQVAAMLRDQTVSGTVSLAPFAMPCDELLMLAKRADGQLALVACGGAHLTAVKSASGFRVTLRESPCEILSDGSEAAQDWSELWHWERVALVGLALGVIERSWQLALDACRVGGDAAGEQVAQFQLADNDIERQAMRALALGAVRQADRGSLPDHLLALVRYATSAAAERCSHRTLHLVSLLQPEMAPIAEELMGRARALCLFNGAPEYEVPAIADGMRATGQTALECDLPSELKLLQSTIRDFVDRELLPLETSLQDPETITPELRVALEAKVKEAGFWAAAVPEELGGGGIGVLGNVLLREQVCRVNVGDARDERGFGGTPWPIVLYANQEQRKRFLDPVIRGEKRHFFAMTEPGAGNDANAISTTAVREGDEWILNGSKAFISFADIADFGVVLAMTDPAKRSRGGLSAFFVEKSRPGFNIVRHSRTIGAAIVHELHFDNCRVPNANLIGEMGAGMNMAASNLTVTRLMQGVISLGLADRALELALAYAQQRSTFGKLLIERGAVQQMLADSAAELTAARLMIYGIAARLDAGEEPRHEAAVAKVFAGEMGSKVLDRAIQIFGGAGLTRDLPLERMFRDQRGFRITEGGTEVQRWVIARDLLRASPGSPDASGKA